MGWLDNFPGLSAGKNMFDSFLHPERGYEDAEEQMRRAWQEAQGFQKPFREAGQGQIGRLNEAENNLLDPSKLLGQWMEKYQMSPYAQKSMQNAKEAGLEGASSMGLMGSSAALNNIQQSSSDIMNKDRDQFLKDLMEKYTAGIGIGQNMFNTGANTAGNQGNQAMEYGNNMGGLAFGARNSPGDLLKQLLAMGGKMFMQH